MNSEFTLLNVRVELATEMFTVAMVLGAGNTSSINMQAQHGV